MIGGEEIVVALESVLERYPAYHATLDVAVDINDFGAVTQTFWMRVRGPEMRLATQFGEEVVSTLRESGLGIVPDGFEPPNVASTWEPGYCETEWRWIIQVLESEDPGAFESRNLEPAYYIDDGFGEETPEQIPDVTDATREAWRQRLDTHPSATNEPTRTLTIDELLGEIDETLADYKDNHA